MFPILQLSGTPYQRGLIHGRMAAPRIAHSIATYGRLFAWCGIDWAQAQRLAAPCRSRVGAAAPDLLEEMAGIADGAGRSRDEILALNARTEILPPTYPGDAHALAAEKRAANAAAGLPDFGECSAVAVQPAASADGRTVWLAQNWDWIGRQRDALVLLRVEESDGMRLVTLTEAGMVAKIGLNQYGLGVCLNILRSRSDGQRAGIPVHVLLRLLLREADVAGAELRARALAFGASSNILCADAHGAAASLEISPDGVTVVAPVRGTLCHTNHFLAGQADAAPLDPKLSTVPRLERLAELTGRGRLGMDDIQTALRDETAGTLSICRRPDMTLPEELRVETVAGVIMDLPQRVMYVAPDIPSRTSFQPVALAAAAQPDPGGRTAAPASA